MPDYSDNERRQSDSRLTDGVPTVWRLPGDAWVMGVLLGRVECYFVGGPRVHVTCAFRSFWAAVAVLTLALNQQRDLEDRQTEGPELQRRGAEHMPEGWQLGEIVAGTQCLLVAVSPTGPLPTFYASEHELVQGARETAWGDMGSLPGI